MPTTVSEMALDSLSVGGAQPRYLLTITYSDVDEQYTRTVEIDADSTVTIEGPSRGPAPAGGLGSVVGRSRTTLPLARMFATSGPPIGDLRAFSLKLESDP